MQKATRHQYAKQNLLIRISEGSGREEGRKKRREREMRRDEREEMDRIEERKQKRGEGWREEREHMQTTKIDRVSINKDIS